MRIFSHNNYITNIYLFVIGRLSAVDLTSEPYISSCNRLVFLFKLSGVKMMNLCITNYTEGKPIPTEAELSVRHSLTIVGDIWVYMGSKGYAFLFLRRRRMSHT